MAVLPLIAGIGDEVVYTVSILCLMILIGFIWRSTHVQSDYPNRLTVTVPLVLHEEEEEEEGRYVDDDDDDDDNDDDNDDGDGVEEEGEDGGGGEDGENRNERGREPRLINEEFENEESVSAEEMAERIRIRLKFINESIKEVRSALSESIGRFKQRHFAADLAQNKWIRLIFNGHVLSGDHRTLRQFGLFDNCVVHCLIHDRRRQNENRSQDPSFVDEDSGLNISQLCFPFVSLIMTLLWWSQLFYDSFNSTSRFALVVLTVIYLFLTLVRIEGEIL